MEQWLLAFGNLSRSLHLAHVNPPQGSGACLAYGLLCKANRVRERVTEILGSTNEKQLKCGQPAAHSELRKKRQWEAPPISEAVTD